MMGFIFDPDGATSYTYVTSGNGIEQPLTVTGPNSISQSYTYDTYGHITQLTESIPGDQDFITGYSYDSWGNNTSVTYPSGVSINKVYDNGYLSEIKKSDNSSIWKVDKVNGLGQPVQFTLGSSSLLTNYSYDTYGNIVHKITGTMEQTDSIDASTANLSGRYYKDVNSQNGLQETFSYDDLDRLTHSHISGQPLSHVSYDDDGNITSKSAVGTYNYMTNKVNTLENITDNYGSISTVAQRISYTASNMTDTITEAPYKLQFVYGPGNQRIKTTLKENNEVIKTKYFLMDYEKEIAGSVTKHFHYIYSPYGLVAVIIKQGTTETLYYAETDRLGSIIGLINPDGTYAEHYSYDAWGRRRNPTDWSFDNVPAATLIDRGYTGQEHSDEFKLINMNGSIPRSKPQNSRYFPKFSETL